MEIGEAESARTDDASRSPRLADRINALAVEAATIARFTASRRASALSQDLFRLRDELLSPSPSKQEGQPHD